MPINNPMFLPLRLIVFVLFFWSIKPIKAQQYVGAVGARFGYGVGITGKYLFNQRGGHGLEFLLRYGYHGLIINKPGAHLQVLYEKHWEIGRRGNWTIYLGGGPGIGIGKRSTTAVNKYFAFGLSPIVGIDFTTQQLRIPLILAFDYKPAFHADILMGKGKEKVRTDFSFYEIAFSVRIGIGKNRRRY